MASSSNLDALLSSSARDLEKGQEVQRVMNSFKLNPYDVLDLSAFASESEVKKQYRKKSLLIHPDKFKHENGMEAFDHLKKAEGILSDTSKRTEIDAIMTHCRTAVLKNVLGSGFTTKIPDTDPRILAMKPPLDVQIRAKAKEVLVQDEMAKRSKTKVAFANEGAEKAKLEAEVASRKRKLEEHAKWEERREERVGSWRDFSTKKGKKSKKNLHVLG